MFADTCVAFEAKGVVYFPLKQMRLRIMCIDDHIKMRLEVVGTGHSSVEYQCLGRKNPLGHIALQMG